MQADQAAIDNARAMLGYTDDHRADRRPHRHPQVDEGNIVHASDATGIVVITQVKPISVFFNLPQQNLRAGQHGLRQRPAAGRRAALRRQDA